MNPVVHFEMPYKDNKRVSKFYQEAFGWQMVDAGEQMGNYVVAETAETDQNHMAKTPGTINGGFYPEKDGELGKSTHVVISVDNLKESIESVKQAGGETIGEQMDIPGIGLYVSIRDSEGNIVGVLQPNMPAVTDK